MTSARQKRFAKQRQRQLGKNRAKANNDGASQRLQQAVQLHQAGQLEAAWAMYHRVLHDNPLQPDAIHLLGVIEHQQGKHHEAVARIRHAISLKPNDAAYHNNLASALQSLDRLDEAILAARQALALCPDDINALCNLGQSLSGTGHFVESDQAFQRVLDLHPDDPGALGMLAHSYETSNRLTAAWELVDRGLPRAPHDILLNVVAARRDRREGQLDGAAQRLQSLLATNRAATEDRFVHFELGRIYDRLGNAPRAFEHFAIGNELSRRRHPAREGNANKQFQDSRLFSAVCTPEWFSAWTPPVALSPEQTPIFLFGFPRSGTTLTDQMLDAHPSLQTLQESPSMNGVRADLMEMPGGYPASMAQADTEDVARLRRRYFDVVERRLERQAETLLVDTHPLYTLHVPMLLRLFPTAKCLFLLRHPYDVCLSCFMHDFKPNTGMVNFRTLETTAAFYVHAMHLWQQYQAVLLPDVHVIRYERLVEDPIAELTAVCDHLNLPFDQRMLGFDDHARRRGRINTPSYDQVTEGLNLRARYRWTRYADQLAGILPALEPLAEQFGYEVDAHAAA